jgi:hypothetical protein
MKFYLPKFQIATLQPPQRKFRSKFGGLPWGLPVERWCRCQQCGTPMSLLAQLSHDPPALDLGGPDHVLHLFQCQECFGFDSGQGNDAVFVPAKSLGKGLTDPPEPLDKLVGELWINGWTEQDDGFDPALAKIIFDQKKWMQLPNSIVHSMFERHRWPTKMGGLPYWTGNGPLQKPRRGYEFLFQLDCIEFEGTPPTPDEVGGMVIITNPKGDQDHREPGPEKTRRNAPWYLHAFEKGRFFASITNLGTDGTAYVFINRRSNPPKVYWFWNR